MIKSFDAEKVLKKIESYNLNDILDPEQLLLVNNCLIKDNEIDKLILKKRMDTQEGLTFSYINIQALIKLEVFTIFSVNENNKNQFELIIKGEPLELNNNNNITNLLQKTTLPMYVSSLSINFENGEYEKIKVLLLVEKNKFK